MKKIDLGKTSEKIKVSLAIDEDIFRLIEDSLAGFKTISLLSRKGYELSALKEEKVDASFSAILNRSEFISQIIQAMQDEKSFMLGEVAYSMKDLALFLDRIAFASLFDYYLDLSRYFGFPKISDLKFLNNEFIETMRSMTLKETIQEIANAANGQEYAKRPNLKKYINLYTESDEKFWDDMEALKEQPFMFCENPIMSSDADYVPYEFILEAQSFDVLIPEISNRAEQILNQIAKDARLELVRTKGDVSDESVDEVRRGMIEDRFQEIVKKVALSNVSNELIAKILRNRLYDEKNTHFVHIFENYVQAILDR